MKKILDINYSKINHMEKLLLDSDFYNRYKIGAVIKYGAVKSLTLGKNYKEDGKYTMSLLSVMKRRFTIKKSEIFGKNIHKFNCHIQSSSVPCWVN